MKRRGLLAVALSITSGMFSGIGRSSSRADPESVSATKKRGIIDINGRYLTMPADGTIVYLVDRQLPGHGDIGATALQCRILRTVCDHAFMVHTYSQFEYIENGQIDIQLGGRVVYFKREPVFATAEDALKHNFYDVYPGESVRVTSESFWEKYCEA